MKRLNSYLKATKNHNVFDDSVFVDISLMISLRNIFSNLYFFAVNLLHNLRMAREGSQQRTVRGDWRRRRPRETFIDALSSIRRQSYSLGYQPGW